MAKSLREEKINKIIYISLGGVAILIISSIILFNSLINKKGKNTDLQFAQKVTDEEIPEIEEANSSIGKSVEQSKEYEDVKEKTAESDDKTKFNGQLAEQLNSNENKTADSEKQEIIANASEDASEGSTISTENSSKKNTVNTENKTENSQEQNKITEEEKDPTFIIPVQGEIVKHYGKEKLIYSETLKEWTTHLGIDIKADKTTIVKASADGVVKSIKNDPRYGLSVVIEHQNGFSTLYANLLTAEFVVVGESVKSGQTIGTVGNSATFEIVDEPHLHFEMMKDGNNIDPEMYVK